MPQGVATIIYGLLVLALFWLNRDHKSRVSAALWIAVVWLWISASRPMSQWFGVAPVMQSPDQYLEGRDRKSTRLNSSHSQISYAVFCLKKKKKSPEKRDA